MDYPAEFRLPENDGFTYSIDAGLARSAGFTAPEQRRRNSLNAHRFQMRLVMPQSDVPAWWRWWIANAYAWFQMPVQSDLAGDAGCAPLRVRCISDLEIVQSAVFGFVEISFEMEHVK